MLALVYAVKLRAFGVTFGAVSGSVDLGRALAPLLATWLRIPYVDALRVPAFEPIVLLDDRGVRLTVERG